MENKHKLLIVLRDGILVSPDNTPKGSLIGERGEKNFELYDGSDLSNIQKFRYDLHVVDSSSGEKGYTPIIATTREDVLQMWEENIEERIDLQSFIKFSEGNSLAEVNDYLYLEDQVFKFKVKI